MDAERAFEEATMAVQRLSKRPSNEALLDLYGLYKQATAGDVAGKRPGILDPRGRAKFDAWAARRGMEREDAMQAYVALVADLQQRDA